jgi:hypothetical protein
MTAEPAETRYAMDREQEAHEARQRELREVVTIAVAMLGAGASPTKLYKTLPRPYQIAVGSVANLRKLLDEMAQSADEERVHLAVRAIAARHPPGTLLWVGEVRSALQPPLPKARFDAAAMRLSRAARLTLHHHDHPWLLSEAARAELIHDPAGSLSGGLGGVFYIGMAPRLDPCARCVAPIGASAKRVIVHRTGELDRSYHERCARQELGVDGD